MNSNKSDRLFIKHLDKIFFGVACLYLVSVLLWLVSQDKFLSKAPEKVQEKPPLSAAETQFMVYLQQSLDNITDQSSQRTLVDPSNPMASTIPIPSQPKIPATVDPISVPYQSSSAPPINPNSPNTSIVQQNPVSSPLPLSTLPTSPTTVPVFTPGQTSPSSSVPPETALTSPPTANMGYTLVGVLESGDRSSALFTFNGVTRRLQLGESIGNSRWVLMGIQEQKAIISLNGKARYLEVGQTF